MDLLGKKVALARQDLAHGFGVIALLLGLQGFDQLAEGDQPLGG